MGSTWSPAVPLIKSRPKSQQANNSRLWLIPLVLALPWIDACGPRQPSTDTGSTPGTETTSADTTSSSQTSSTGTDTESSTDTESGTDIESDTGTDTESDTDTGEPACDEAAHTACLADAASEAAACFEPCAPEPGDCGQEACAWACKAQHSAAKVSCAELHCPAALGEGEPLEELAACDAEAHACFASPNCELNTCHYDAFLCAFMLEPCAGLSLELDFDYAGSCEIMLPGAHWFPELCTVEIGGEVDQLSYDELSCGGNIGAYYLDQDADHLRLCPAQCVSFEQAGSLTFAYLPPDCP